MNTIKTELPPLPEALEINWPNLHSEALGCGVEDRGIHDRYDAAAYGWQDGVDKAIECVPEHIYDADQMRAYAAEAVRAALAAIEQREAVAWPEPVAFGPYSGLYSKEQVQQCIEAARSEMISAAVNRFLCWKLPKDFNPDCGISFDGRKDDEFNKNKTWPVGTNLLHAGQAKAMFEHCLMLATPPAAPIADGGDAVDAKRWRSLLSCARIRPLGSAGLNKPEPNNYAHLGLELWTTYDRDFPSNLLQRLDEDTKAGQEWLTKFADISAAAIAASGVKP